MIYIIRSLQFGINLKCNILLFISLNQKLVYGNFIFILTHFLNCPHEENHLKYIFVIIFDKKLNMSVHIIKYLL